RRDLAARLPGHHGDHDAHGRADARGDPRLRRPLRHRGPQDLPRVSGDAPDRAELAARQERQGQSYWALVWTQLKKSPSGMGGLVVIVALAATSLLAPLLANDRPIVVRYEDATYFPAFRSYVDAWVPWRSMRDSLKSWKLSDDPPY